jgi:GTPase SAR1 family protein
LQASYLDKRVTVGTTPVQLSIWDTAGQVSTHTHTYLPINLHTHTHTTHTHSHIHTRTLTHTHTQERFHALGPIYYRDAAGALLVYDITDAESFNKVKREGVHTKALLMLG